jgi:glutamate carboxypeptidase
MSSPGLASFLKSIEEESFGTLRQLVAINSFTLNRAGLNANVDLCSHMFEPLGFAVQRVPSVDPRSGDHLFLSKPGKSGQKLLMVAHLDTVFSLEQEKEDGHVWREEGDRIYGPGTADMKGGVVLMAMVCRALREVEPTLFQDLGLELCLNATEESGCEDFPRLARAKAQGALACLVYESGKVGKAGSAICTSRKGSAGFFIDVQGKAAHSGENHAQGASAIRELARLVERIEAMTDHVKGLTFNVGLVSGGTVVNAVPGRASCQVDLRALTRQDYDAGRMAMQGLSGEGSVASQEGGFRCRIKVREIPRYGPWPENEASRRLAKTFQAAAKVLGQGLTLRAAGGASDGNHLADLAPTLDELGPLGANIHCSANKPDLGLEPEYALKSSFFDRAMLNVEAIKRIAKGEG